MMPEVEAISIGGQAATNPQEGARFQERRVTMQDGTGLYVRDYAAAAGAARHLPLLCLPGFTRDSRDFHELALRLCATRRIVCPDLRGRGRSEWMTDSARYAPRTILNDVRDLAAALGLGHAVVLGASFGGLIAMALAVACPRLLAGVILNDVGPHIARAELAKIARYIAAAETQPDWLAAARFGRDLLGADWDRRDDETWLKLARQSYSEGPDGRLHLDYDPAIAKPLTQSLGDATLDAELWHLFGALRSIPTLVLRGFHSRVLSPETLAAMIRAKPDLRHVTVAGVGHMPLLDEAKSIEAIDGFLAGL